MAGEPRPRKQLAPALELQCRYAWPGNVREFRNVIERIMVLHGREPIIRAEMLPAVQKSKA